MKKAILCIDDERIVLESLRGQLWKHFGNGYQYEFAESAEEGYEIIEELIAVHQRFPQIVKVLLSICTAFCISQFLLVFRFGGAENRKFMVRRLRLPMKEQKAVTHN